MNKIFSNKVFITLFICFSIVNIANAQFWFGPKFGGQMVTHKYADKDYEKTVDVSSDFNFHAGLAFEYTTETNFAAHVDFLYQKVTNTIKNLPDTSDLFVSTNYHFFTAPIMLKRVFGNGPVTFYVNFGPRISFWFKGDGKYYEDELQEFLITEPVSFNVVFNTDEIDASATPFSKRNVPRPTRLQYAFDIGGGVQLDLASGQRLVLDFAYSFGHSNMGFNVDDGFIFYQSNLEFSNNMLRFSVAYMFGYDPTYKRKGASSSGLGK